LIDLILKEFILESFGNKQTFLKEIILIMVIILVVKAIKDILKRTLLFLID
jgi:hypothetical protein